MSRSRELAELATAYDSGSPLGFRNRIINGQMVIDQRNAGASVTPTTTTNGFPTDRFQVSVSQNSKLTTQQSTVAPTGFSNSLLVTSSSAYSVLSSDVFVIRQSIEGFNFYDLGFGTASAATITLSFWVRSSLTGTFGGSLSNYAATRSYPFSYTISAANTWEQKTVTIAGDTSGTWVGASSSGAASIWFGLGVGATSSGTAGSWSGSDFRSATGATSVVGTNGATFYITGVQLERGSTATSFDFRPYGTELALCQRYYERITIGLGGGYAAGGINISNQARVMLPFSAPKRVTPSMSSSAASTFAVQVNNGNVTPTSISYAGTTSVVSSYVFVVGTFTLNHPCILMDAASNSYFEASSEL